MTRPIRRRRRFAIATLLVFALVGCQQIAEQTPPSPVERTDSDEVIAPLPKAAANEVIHAPRTRFPLFGSIPTDRAAMARLVADPYAAQPWLRGPKTPPVSLHDLGLKGSLRLADFSGTKIEWGIHLVVEDVRGNLFAFCSRERWNRAGDDYVDAFYLGGIVPNKRLVRIEEGTPSYKFLQALAWHFADDPRYRASQEKLNEARAMLHLSETEFAELLRPPAWP